MTGGTAAMDRDRHKEIYASRIDILPFAFGLRDGRNNIPPAEFAARAREL